VKACIKVLRSVHYIGELTAKEVFVLLSFPFLRAANTGQHVPMDPGARAGLAVLLHGYGRSGDDAPKLTSVDPGRPNVSGGEALAVLQAVTASFDWALKRVQGLELACDEYRMSAPQRNDELRNKRVARERLLDMADVEVMACLYMNYLKLKMRCPLAEIPVTPRGWVRRVTS
jgi:hypothetical protein